MSNLDALHARAKALKLHGLLAHWTEVADAGWVEALIDWEEQERGRLISAASNPPVTSIGPGPNVATARPSKP